MRYGLRYASRLSMADHVVLARCCADVLWDFAAAC